MSVVPQDHTSPTCELSEGDLIQAAQTPEAGDLFVRMRVITAKQESCRAGSEVVVSTEDLQRIQNEFSETIEEGSKRLEEMQKD